MGGTCISSFQLLWNPRDTFLQDTSLQYSLKFPVFVPLHPQLSQIDSESGFLSPPSPSVSAVTGCKQVKSEAAGLLNGWPPGCLWADADYFYWPRLSPCWPCSQNSASPGMVIVKRRACERIHRGWNTLSGVEKAMFYFHHWSERGKKVPWYSIYKFGEGCVWRFFSSKIHCGGSLDLA